MENKVKLFSRSISEHLGYKIFVIGIPIIIQNLMQFLQLQVDMALLGHYDPLMLSAVGNVLFPYNIHVSFMIAISLGATILISHNIGANDIFKAKRFAEVSFFYNTIISALFFVYLYFLTPSILIWMNTPAEVYSYASDYMRILSYSFILYGIECSITAVLQGVGVTKHIMYAGVIRTIVNIFLDWVLIYGYLGFPEMGISGAAIATTISNFAAAVYFVFALAASKGLKFNISLKGLFNPNWSIQKENIKVGLPTGLEFIFWSIGQIAIIRIVNELDPYSSGLYVMIGRIQAFTFFIYIGIARATMILVGQKIGAGEPEEAFRVTKLSLRYALILCIIMAILFLTIPEKILSIFTSEVQLIDRVSNLFYIISYTIFPVAINVIVGNAIRGAKDTRWMLYTQTIGTFMVVCVSALMVLVFRLNLWGVFITILLDETFRAVLNSVRFFKGKEYILKLIRLRV